MFGADSGCSESHKIIYISAAPSPSKCCWAAVPMPATTEAGSQLDWSCGGKIGCAGIPMGDRNPSVRIGKKVIGAGR